MRKLILITGLVILVSVAGCSKDPNAPTKPANQVIEEGFFNLAEVTSYSFDLLADVNLNAPKGEQPEKLNIDLNLNGKVDLSNVEDPKLDLKLNITGDAGSQKASGDLSALLNKEAFYFNLLKLDLPEEAGLSSSFVANYLNKWWKMPVPPNVLDQISKAFSQGAVNKLGTEQKDIFKKNNFVKNPKYISTENINGEDSYRYTFDLDEKAFMNFAKEAAIAQGNPFEEEDLKSIEEGLKKLEVTGNLWVSKEKNLLNKVVIDANLLNEDTRPSGTVSLNYSVYDIAKEVIISVPESAEDFPTETLLGLFLLGQGFDSNEEGGLEIPSTTQENVDETLPAENEVPEKTLEEIN